MINTFNQRLMPSALVSKLDRPVALSGGTERIINGMRYHVITSSSVIEVISGGLVYALIVAGGGSKKSNGGGGGGGLANYLPVAVPTGAKLNVVIGASPALSDGGNTTLTCLRPATLTGGGGSATNGGSGGGCNSNGGTRGLGNTPAFEPSQGNNGSSSSYVGGGGGGFAAAATFKDGAAGLALDADTQSLGALIQSATHFSSGGGGNGDIMYGGTNGAGGPGAGVGGYGASNTSGFWPGCGAGGGPNNTTGYPGIVVIRYPV